MAIALGCTHLLTVIQLIFVLLTFAQDGQFIYNGFQGAMNLHLDGLANIHPNGLLQLTNYSIHQTSHAFYPHPMIFKPNLSFSTTFIFAMYPQVPNHSGHGIVFVISPSMNFQHTLSSAYLGLFNVSSNGLTSNHVFAVELDTIQNAEFEDIDGNHVGFDVNSLKSIDSTSASYYCDKQGVNRSLVLNSGKPMKVWIDYDGVEMLVNVTLAPVSATKPSKCLLSKHINLSAVLLDSMYIGFSSCTGLISNNHYILGWSWNQSGVARELTPSKLPSLPRTRSHRPSLNLSTKILLIVLVLLLLVITGVAWAIRRKKYEELNEPWEQDYAPHRLSYKDLFVATKGFRNSELLGAGGFGKVYKGVLPSTHTQIAVKRISHDSRQGMKEFVAEIASMRRLRHRNLVQLLGYCRREGELLLAYEYMPNGSLDKLIFGNDVKSRLCWSQRFKIVKGVASALVYLHEEWEQVVVHRDIKASNVLLDANMNARLGDFGLARLYDHGTNHQTTHVVGTLGYIAPEVSRTRMPTPSSDVFSFGIFLLEVASGRRPISQQDEEDNLLLVDWAYNCWKKGAILEVSDPRLEGSYATEEMELVLKLGLLCSHPKAEARPIMRQVVQSLDRVVTLPDVISSDYDDSESTGFLVKSWGTKASKALLPSSFPSSSGIVSYGASSSTNSVLQCGR